MGALSFATTLLASLPQLLAGGVEVLGLIQSGTERLKAFAAEKRDPTQEEWDALNASIEAKRKELHS